MFVFYNFWDTLHYKQIQGSDFFCVKSYFCFISALLLGCFIYTTGDRLHGGTLRKKPGDFDDEDDETSKLAEEDCPPEEEEEDCQNEDD